jgi:signal transduction histidine kinase
MPTRSLTDHDAENRFRTIERRFVRLLLIGFGLVLIAMLASGLLGLRAMNRISTQAGVLAEHYLKESDVLDGLLRHQANLGFLLHSLAETKPGVGVRRFSEQAVALRGQVETALRQAESQQPPPTEMAAWREVGIISKRVFGEIDRLIAADLNDSVELSSTHRALLAATAELIRVSHDQAAATRAEQLRHSAATMNSAGTLFLGALLAATICAGVSIAGSVALFQRIETRADALSKLSVHILSEQEDAARRFSQDMHDEFGQALNAVESTLTVMKPRDAENGERIRDAIALVKDAQSMAREMSHLLRPRILDDFGLDAGLRELASGFSRRTGIMVDYRSNVRERIDPDVETHLFRIAQEALTNTSRHTMASLAEISLERSGRALTLTVADNGGGLSNQSSKAGLGMLGMRERARASKGHLVVESRAESGVVIRVSVPCTEASPVEKAAV